MQEKLEELARALALLRGEETKAHLLARKREEAQIRRLRIWFENELMRRIDEVKSEKRRRVLELKYLDGLRPCQIRRILGISASSYYRRLKGR